MIVNQWYVVLESKQVGRKPIGVTRMGEKLIFWRDQTGSVNCAVDRCPHRGVALSIGKIEHGNLQCPFHGFEFDASGRCVYIPANGRDGRIPASLQLQNYPTFEDHGFIWIWWGDSLPVDLQPPLFFDNLDDSFMYGSKPDYWKAHYSRVIENQLDVVHLPFVHQKTIGRGNNMVVDGPVVQWDGDMKMTFYVFNRPDDGTPPRKPREIDLGEFKGVHLELIMPNLWQNYISDDVRVLAAFVPVDDQNTILYLRFYQRFMPVPVLGKLVAQLAMPANVIIAHEDRRVVVTHQPQPSSVNIGEKLIQGDLPIIEYRKRRAQLKNQV
ncbi:MAG: aromatic ring-hydroxylating dioxygenase subunit alpha [Anaerolineales bacterium]|nr:aromatic ring-hydroxylating dioxygenase subunit alpha [Anaerolineales bacterium]